jgi:hypothetical protein
VTVQKTIFAFKNLGSCNPEQSVLKVRQYETIYEEVNGIKRTAKE